MSSDPWWEKTLQSDKTLKRVSRDQSAGQTTDSLGPDSGPSDASPTSGGNARLKFVPKEQAQCAEDAEVWELRLNGMREEFRKLGGTIRFSQKELFLIVLRNLPVWVTAEDIKKWLTADNLVADSVNVLRNRETHKSKGFAFIETPDGKEMKSIIRRFDGAPLEDRLLSACRARPPVETNEGVSREGEGMLFRETDDEGFLLPEIGEESPDAEGTCSFESASPNPSPTNPLIAEPDSQRAEELEQIVLRLERELEIANSDQRVKELEQTVRHLERQLEIASSELILARPKRQHHPPIASKPRRIDAHGQTSWTGGSNPKN